MQELGIKEQVEDGGKNVNRERKVKVIRSWSDASGKHIYLHADGTYGYKDESPIIDPKEFEIIGDPTQKRMAFDWWKRKGEKTSKKFYADVAKGIERKNLSRSGIPHDMQLNLDAALYMRKENKKGGQFGEPSTWQEMGFNERPAWWGTMLSCVEPQFTYELSNPEAVGIKEPE